MVPARLGPFQFSPGRAETFRPEARGRTRAYYGLAAPANDDAAIPHGNGIWSRYPARGDPRNHPSAAGAARAGRCHLAKTDLLPAPPRRGVACRAMVGR